MSSVLSEFFTDGVRKYMYQLPITYSAYKCLFVFSDLELVWFVDFNECSLPTFCYTLS